LQFGARIESVEVNGTPISDVHTVINFTPISGSAGVLYDVTPTLKLGLTLSSAARAPANTELFARGPHDGPNTFEVGDPNLKEERANSLEATLRVRKPSFDFEGSAWGVAYGNFIYGDVTGNLCDDSGVCDNAPGNDLKQLFYRQHDAVYYGAEGKGSVPLANAMGGTISIDMIADVVRAEFTGSLGNVPRIPPYHIGGGLSFDADAVNAGFLLAYSGRQDETATAESPTKSFVSLDANVAWRPFASRTVELALVGHNLTDSVQRSAVSINKDEIILPGRDVRFVVRVPL
jgi:iron complex outermembrane receptor protein